MMTDLEPSRHSTVPVSATDTSPAHWIRPAAVLPLLERIEALPEGATGALLVGTGTNPRGVVLVEGGRICWAVASEMKRRLIDLLRHQAQPGLATTSIEQVYAECRDHNRPLGEGLVASGLITERGLRRALRQHNSEAIAVMSAAPGVPADIKFTEHKHKRYDARFTFSTIEMLITLGALNDQATATLARIALKQYVPEGGSGAAYTRDKDGSGIIPVGEVGTSKITSETLMELGSWATSTLDVATAVATDVKAITGTTAAGQSIVAWLQQGIIYMVLCPTLVSYARLLASLARREQRSI